MYECSEPCPECGGQIEWDFACHTYPRTVTREDGTTWEQWMACMPCDSATRYVCVAHNEERCGGIYASDCEEGYHEGCGWTWTNGLNSGNPRAADNETRDPHWDE